MSASSRIQPAANHEFDQPIILQRSPFLSRAIVWGIVGVTTFCVIWANVAKIEEAIPATGKLEPQGAVNEVKVPLNGVVKTVAVKDGQQVKQGDLLLTLDSTIAQSQQTSLQLIRSTLMAENQFYRSVLNGTPLEPQSEGALKLSAEMTGLAKTRSALLAENQLFQAQLTGTATGANLTPAQQIRMRASMAELDSRRQAAELEVAQLERQLVQTQSQLVNAREILSVSEGIFNSLEPLAKVGGVARVQFLRQQQEVLNSQTQVNQLTQEAERLKLAIEQAQEKLTNTLALTEQDVLTKIAENEKRIAEIDSQLNKAIVENEKRIAEVDSQLSQAQQTLQYQELKAPVSGTIFDLKASGPGFVANPTEPVLKIVPDQALVADVVITNKDIGFIREGMPVDIRIDSFPHSEFGDIKGELMSVGSDALPPTQIRPFYSFPAKVKLFRQTLRVQNREIPLQSGMSVSVNIKVRQRTIMSIFTDQFTQQVESLKFVR
jgi:HlyD family secretion protein